MDENNSMNFDEESYSSLQGTLVSGIQETKQMADEQEFFYPNNYIQQKEEKELELKILREKRAERRKGFGKALVILLASVIFAGALLISVTYAGDFFANLVSNGSFSFPVINQKEESETSTTTPEGEYTSISDLAKVIRKSCVTVLFPTNYENTESIASGVIIGEENDLLYILTCGHVVKNKSSLTVRFDGETEGGTSAYVRGYDPDTDLGIIYVYKSAINSEVLKEIKIATLGDSTLLQEGETVIAVSSPVSSTFANTVTVGVVSCALREVTLVDSENVGTSYNMIQTDCAINTGASGGGLFNGRGELVGVCNATLVDVDSEGIFFAAPITPNKEIIVSLINIGKYVRPYLAITGTDATNWTGAQAFDITKGVYVVSVVDGGPAYRAGLKAGDIILKFDGVDVNTMDELKQFVLDGSVDKAVVLDILRLNDDGTEMKAMKINLILGDKTNYYE